MIDYPKNRITAAEAKEKHVKVLPSPALQSVTHHLQLIYGIIADAVKINSPYITTQIVPKSDNVDGIVAAALMADGYVVEDYADHSSTGRQFKISWP